MLRLWRDRIAVFLAPDRVDLTLIRRGVRRRAAAVHSQECAAGASAADWRPAIGALRTALDALDWRRAEAEVTLSNHFVRLALVPGAGAAARNDERAALARHALRSTFGERAVEWLVALGEPATEDGLAAGIDAQLLEALRAALAPASIALVAVRPFLADAFNGARRALAPGAAWLAVAEPGRLCVAHLEAGRWVALRSQRTADPLPEALVTLLEQMCLAHGLPAGGEVCLIARDADDAAPDHAGDWILRRLALAGA